MTGQRLALIVATSKYDHDGLRHLLAPAADAARLAEVLGDPQIGDFDVQVVRDRAAHEVQEKVEGLFATGRPDDVLLVHFSCHGLKSESGELFLAARNTRPDRLGSTAVPADFVQRCLRTSRSRNIVLLLDYCYGGAFGQGVTVRASGDVNVTGNNLSTVVQISMVILLSRSANIGCEPREPGYAPVVGLLERPARLAGEFHGRA